MLARSHLPILTTDVVGRRFKCRSMYPAYGMPYDWRIYRCTALHSDRCREDGHIFPQHERYQEDYFRHHYTIHSHLDRSTSNKTPNPRGCALEILDAGNYRELVAGSTHKRNETKRYAKR